VDVDVHHLVAGAGRGWTRERLRHRLHDIVGAAHDLPAGHLPVGQGGS
jgi:hypothetical protein